MITILMPLLGEQWCLPNSIIPYGIIIVSGVNTAVQAQPKLSQVQDNEVQVV